MKALILKISNIPSLILKMTYLIPIVMLVGCCSGDTVLKQLETSEKSSKGLGCIAGFVYDPENRLTLYKNVNVIAQSYVGKYFSSESADTTRFGLAIKDSSGFYMIKNVPAGKYRLVFSTAGYYAKCINVIVISGFTTFLDRIALQRTDLDWEIVPAVSEGIYVKNCDIDTERIVRVLRFGKQ